MISTAVEKVDMSEYYYEIMFRTNMMFKNECYFNDKIFMIVGKDDR